MSRRLRVLAGGLAAQGELATGADGFGQALAEAQARGYALGAEEARLAAEAEWRGRVESLQGSFAALSGAIETLRDELDRHAVDAALRVGVEVAQRILEREVAVDPAAAARSVEAGLERLPGATEIEIHLHPLDLEQLGDAAPTRPTPGGRLRYVGDPSVGRGGAVIHSDAGLVDARLDQQLRAAADHLSYGTRESL